MENHSGINFIKIIEKDFMDLNLCIVLVNYNNSNDTIECLESILNSENQNFQVFIIDNSENEIHINKFKNWSKTKNEQAIFLDQDEFLIKKHQEKLIFVKADKNKGFSHANNIALKNLLNEYDDKTFIWILNNDTIIGKLATHEILNKINKHKLNLEFDIKKDIIGTPLMEYYNPNLIQAIGGKYNKKTGLTSHVGESIDISIERKEKIIEKIKEVDYPIGASIIINKEFLNEIGLLCEEYFLFYEELDWIYRSKEKGGKLIILDVFDICHKQGESTKTKTHTSKSEFIDLISINSRLLFAKKFNKENLNIIGLKILLFSIGKRILQGEIKRIPKIIKIVFNYL